jgi:hypothetical protein
MTSSPLPGKKASAKSQLIKLLHAPEADYEAPLTNREAARYLGVSGATLARHAFPLDPEGPRFFQYTEKGNRYWDRAELDAYKARKQEASDNEASGLIAKLDLVGDVRTRTRSKRDKARREGFG